MKGYGVVTGTKPEAIAEYKPIHAAVGPDLLKQIRASKISDCSIYLKEPANLMVAYPRTQEWWTGMEEVFPLH